MLVYLKAFGLGQQKVEAAEPVGENQQDVYEVDDTPKIGPNGSTLNDVVILNGPINLRKGGESLGLIVSSMKLSSP